MFATTIITPALMYWITRLNAINYALGILTGICVVGSVVFIIATVINLADKHEVLVCFCKCCLKRIITVLVIALLGLIFLPNLKEMCAILVVPAIANNEKVQSIGEEFYDAAKEWLKELNPTKKRSIECEHQN